METKHTPGPWFSEETATNNMIDIFHMDRTPGAITRALCRVQARATWLDEAKQNARLIAAAPELLQALKHIDDTAAFDNECDPASKTWGAILAARAAIAKAEGK